MADITPIMVAKARKANARLKRRMDPRSRRICEGFWDGETLKSLGAEFGITGERARQILVKWRIAGFELPGEAPLSEAAKRPPRSYYVPRWRAVKELTKEPMVYVATCSPGWYKIGVTSEIKKRIQTLSTEIGLSTLCVYSRASDCPLAVESIAHSLLANKILEGEWFLVSEAEAIAAVKRAFDALAQGVTAPKKLYRGAMPRPIPKPEGTFFERMTKLAEVVAALKPGETQRDFVLTAIANEIKRRE